ncbi:SDR family NAD(P)-dependent oxidoreductase [Porphyrobacter sp. CACIAM 03H1]|uniref:SDR family NAD(P)-dependent oxidoreductase n=1 Tax=Porphyrobacter sp. CACIAM 03H1 TaxID=2003315 RepID=UPI000B5A3A45|nr:SDR family NAD(P)-dependent oxidoreductase [Porphyrobacter sp. CACIAM 03H1]ASJ90464.1 CDP-paratose 2-epimerase [Porphyrobacter sp. CACIAM 03H1]
MRLEEGRTILVTGGAGFIGSNLAMRLLERGCRVRILDSLERPGTGRNLEWLTARHGDRVEPVVADLRDPAAIARAVRGVDGAFHFAAQVAVTTSLADPAADFAVNLGGTFALLETLRRERPGAPLIFASTNKVYGDLADIALTQGRDGYAPAAPDLAAHGVGEARPLDFHTPYGCSKGAADQYVLDYARSYGMPAAVLRMSCIYGERQMGTEDQGWVAHFLLRALAGETITLYGDGHQVRDICDVADTCAAYVAAFERIDSIAGRAFNWGGGPENAVSLLTVVGEIRRILGTAPPVTSSDWRAGDQRWFVADTRAIDAALGLGPRKGWRTGLTDLAAWLSVNRAATPPAAAPAPAREQVW